MTGFWSNFWDSILQPRGRDVQLIPSILLASLMAVVFIRARVEWSRTQKIACAALVVGVIFAGFAGTNHLDALFSSDRPGPPP